MTATAAATRVPPSPLLLAGRAVAVLRADHAERYRPVIDVLVDAGITSIELTLTTPGTTEVVQQLVRQYAGRAEIGVGTVLSRDVAIAVLDAGAAFLVTPTVQPDVIQVASGAGRAVFPGAYTPTEIQAGWNAGATAVKVFPASSLGPAYFRSIAGPFPDIPLMPSGGVSIDSIPEWLAAGAIAVSLGGELLGDSLRGGDLAELASRARRCRDAVDSAGSADSR
ncbi:bifunctional 4-hydroxy-2-oxoglutarate aldolase/2-dehydro-3-deoxy-phosphogluconate aldolase [uncultured Amnibacterium sp.]|uniref:bifunctional 4-hydroxy-2-oxoglutarate aldolase/2-dehydro-3-deoxy-phosphogluconate aldolase n=1 Tax=uncultured Amnibacterium sp. TaxID=1631851 RepID=UPI0035CA4DE4